MKTDSSISLSDSSNPSQAFAAFPDSASTSLSGRLLGAIGSHSASTIKAQPELNVNLKFPMWVDGYTKEEIIEFCQNLNFILDLPEGHNLQWKKLKSEVIGYEPYLFYTHTDQLVDDVVNSFIKA